MLIYLIINKISCYLNYIKIINNKYINKNYIIYILDIKKIIILSIYLI